MKLETKRKLVKAFARITAPVIYFLIWLVASLAFAGVCAGGLGLFVRLFRYASGL